MIEPFFLIVKNIIPARYHAKVFEIFCHIRSYCYVGHAFECPFCHRTFRKFLSGGVDVPVLKYKKVIGAGHYHNVLCPRCMSLDRERLVLLYIARHTDIFKAIGRINVLHIAPEKNLTKLFSKHPGINYLSADISSPFAMARMDITRISCRDSTFDFVICSHVLEHILDDTGAMTELLRVLRPGGKALLQVPISLSLEHTFEDGTVITPEDRERFFGQSDHVRIYTAEDFMARLRKAGFVVNQFKSSNFYGKMDFPIDMR